MNINNIRRIMPKGRILEHEPMKKHTSFRVGGEARWFLIPANTKEAAGLIRYFDLNQIAYYVIGNGTNLLVSDEGYDGVIIQLGHNDDTSFTQLGIDDESDPVRFDAGAGCLLGAIGKYAQQFGGSGFEGLSGIPGCIGGAAVMNAGAYGMEFADVVESVEVITPKGEIKRLNRDEIHFGYRHTSLMDDGLIVTRVMLALKKDDPAAIKTRMEEFQKRRKEKQPLEYPSAGSAFKRPEGHFAGQLIEEAGLRGYAIGGAAVSEKHCGFIINRGGATASDVAALLRYVADRVEETSGIRLEPEIRLLGNNF